MKYKYKKQFVVTSRVLAHLISVLLHPLLLPTYIIVLLGSFSSLALTPLNTDAGIKFLMVLVFLSTFFLPFLLLALYVMIKDTRWTLRSFLMENSKERVFPFLMVGALYSILLYFIRKAPQLNEVIVIILATVTICILAVALISNFWKISAHAVGVCGMIMLLGIINNTTPDSNLFIPITILIVMAGFLMSARLYLNAHTPVQMLAGALLGVTIGSFSYFFL